MRKFPSERGRRGALSNALTFHTRMPLDDDAISALSNPELRVRAERVPPGAGGRTSCAT